MQRRTEVLAKLEALRADKVIGKALEAVVTLYIGRDSRKIWRRDTQLPLPELFNVSEVDLLTWSTPATQIALTISAVERFRATPNATAAGATSPT